MGHPRCIAWKTLEDSSFACNTFPRPAAMGVSWDSSYGAGPARLSNKDINSELLRHQQPAAGALLEDGRLLNLGLPSPRTPLTNTPLRWRGKWLCRPAASGLDAKIW